MLFSGKRKHSVVFTLALGIADRPKRWHTPGTFFVRVGDVLEQWGIDCYYVAHPVVRLQAVDRRTSWRMESAEALGDVIAPLRPSYLFVWNGNAAGDRETVRVAERMGIQCVFAEIGWFPQSETVYFDWDGTNFRSSIRRLDVDAVAVDPRLDKWVADYLAPRVGQTVAEPGYVFVPLQDETDTNITEASPYKTMDAFVCDVSMRLPTERIIVRRHPRFMDVELGNYSNVEYRNDGELYDWLRGAKAVIGINSTVLLEALLLEKPIVAMGQGLASGLGVFHEPESAADIDPSEAVTHGQRERRRKLLSELIFRRMLCREALSDPAVLGNNFVFQSMRARQRRSLWRAIPRANP